MTSRLRVWAALFIVFVTLPVTASAQIVINELSCAASDWVEIYNSSGSTVNLLDWEIYWTDSTGSGTFVLPDFDIAPGAHVQLRENTGTNGADYLYLGGNIGWAASEEGSLTLFNPSGIDKDFVRWGGATNYPPTGTTQWINYSDLPTPAPKAI